MSTTGRYWVIDLATGHRTCVEPISERSQRLDDMTWDKGNHQVQGGAIRREDSIITEANGFINIREM